MIHTGEWSGGLGGHRGTFLGIRARSRVEVSGREGRGGLSEEGEGKGRARDRGEQESLCSCSQHPHSLPPASSSTPLSQEELLPPKPQPGQAESGSQSSLSPPPLWPPQPLSQPTVSSPSLSWSPSIPSPLWPEPSSSTRDCAPCPSPGGSLTWRYDGGR